MNKTQAEISRLKNCSRQAVKDFISRNDIQPAGQKGKYPTYDCTAEPLASYLGAKFKPAASTFPDVPKSSAKTASNPKNDAAIRRVSKPLNNLVAGITKPGQKPAELFFAEALKIAKANQDAGLYFKLGQIAAKEEADEAVQLQAIKTEQAKEQIAQEKAERLRLENEISRGDYMAKTIVKLIFGKYFSIDSSVINPLGLKLSDVIDALPPSPTRRAKIQKLLDDEIFAAQENKSKLMEKYIGSLGNVTVDNAVKRKKP